jgi:hypothetical protein
MEEFGIECKIEVTFKLDKVVTLARCYRPAVTSDAVPVVQALSRRPIKGHGSAWVAIFSVMLDCWHQLDRGVLGARPPVVSHGWDRRPEVPRRRQ